ncbi:MAG: hypothetical protein MK008_00025 [Bdellovibrionales bacterium]|nr:hypothetical protein [Bdellovibrionales bacterium]
MTKQKWILLTLCIGILWGTDTLFQSLWSENTSNVTQSEDNKLEFEKTNFNKVKPKKQFTGKTQLQQKPVKVVSTDKGLKALEAVKSPSPKKKGDNLEDLAKKYDKKLAQKKKVPEKKAAEDNSDEKTNTNNNRNSYANSNNRSNNDFFTNDERTSSANTGEFSVITPNAKENQANNLGGGAAFTANSDMTIRQWSQALTNNPSDSEINDFITAIRQGNVDQDEAYQLVETLLRSESEDDHSNAIKVVMAIKSPKSFILLTDVVSGGFSESVNSAAYSGLLNYRSYDDLAIIEEVLKKENLSLGTIYFSADTILQLSQQTVPTYGDEEQRTVTMLDAYMDRFLLLSDLLKETSVDVADERVLGQVNQTVAFIGGPEAVADGSVAKPNYRALF